MGLLAALLLQAEDLGKKAQPHIPGSEGLFSRVAIALFIVGLIIGGGIAIRMVIRGAAGASSAEKEKVK